jgi:transcriptional regulator with XRE-family HTH domain
VSPTYNFISHTWTYPNLDRASYNTALNEFRKNDNFGKSHFLNYSSAALVTPESAQRSREAHDDATTSVLRVRCPEETLLWVVPSEMATRRAELKQFLKERRAAIDPEACGFPRGRRRLTRGLRREEVASIADVGVTWYTWLEQGRDISISRDTADRIAAALQLSPTDRKYFFTLIWAPEDDGAQPRKWLERADPALQGVLDGFTSGPAFASAPTFDVIGFNRLANVVYRFTDFEASTSRFRRNMLWQYATSAARRAIYEREEATIVRISAGLLRSNYVAYVGDAYFEELIAVLREKWPQFDLGWQQMRTTALTVPSEISFVLPGIGEIRLHVWRCHLPEREDHIVTFLPPADPHSAAALVEALKQYEAGKAG